MFRKLFAGGCALALLAFSACALAGGERVHSYTLPHRGELHLTTPDTWQDDIKPGENGMPPTIVFHPAKGDAFKVLVTAVAPMAGSTMAMPGQDKIRDSIGKARAEAASQAVEKHIVLHELRSANATGYYFTATDKAPGSGPDDYRIMTHFEVVAGRSLLLVTAFYNDDHDKVREHTQAMLERAEFKTPDQASAQAQHAGAEQRIQISKVHDGYHLTVPLSKLAITIPGANLELGPGGSDSPRYFYFHDRSQGLIISGWFEPAETFPGIKPFWNNETETWKKHNIPGPKDVKFENIGKWQAIAYDVELPAPNATDSHLRAEYVDAGTWIDLHISMTSKLSSATSRARLRDLLKSIDVQVKK